MCLIRVYVYTCMYVCMCICIITVLNVFVCIVYIYVYMYMYIIHVSFITPYLTGPYDTLYVLGDMIDYVYHVYRIVYICI